VFREARRPRPIRRERQAVGEGVAQRRHLGCGRHRLGVSEAVGIGDEREAVDGMTGEPGREESHPDHVAVPPLAEGVDARGEAVAVRRRVLPAGVRVHLAQVSARVGDPRRQAVADRPQADLQQHEAERGRDGGGEPAHHGVASPGRLRE
jgi:hypothetical protein